MRRGPRLQRFWHREKLNVMDQLIEIRADDVVIDVGCGSGNLTTRAGRSTDHAVGLDASLDAVLFCRSRPDAYRCSFAVAAGDRLPIAGGTADVALLVEVIEHLANPLAVLSEIRRTLRPGGLLLVTTPNYSAGSLWPVLEWLADRSGRVAEMADEQHVQKFTPTSLVQTLAGAGFTVGRLGTFYRWSPVWSLISPGRAASSVQREVASGRLDGCLVYALAVTSSFVSADATRASAEPCAPPCTCPP
jgi:SAM-dependent methyltransferase